MRSFRLCGSEQDLWVTDNTSGGLARVYEELTSSVYQELYSVVLGTVGPRPDEGFGADYQGSISVTRLLHAAPESHACEEDLTGIDLRASGQKDHILLEWITESEIDNSGFEIQRSTDGHNFNAIGWVDGNGTTDIIKE